MRLKSSAALVVGLVLLVVLIFSGLRPTPTTNAPLRDAVLPESDHTAPSPTTSNTPITSPRTLPGRTNSLDSFETWLRSYLRGSIDERLRIESVGLQLAQARRAALRELIESDPERAWESRVRWPARAELPVEIQEQLEEMVSARGDLEVLGAIPYANQTTEFRPVVRWATFQEKSYTAFAYGRYASQPTRHNISLHGIAIDGALAVADSPLRVLDPGEPPSQEKVAAADSCPVSGRRTVDSQPAGSSLTVESGDEVFRLCDPAHAAALGDRLWQQEAVFISPQALARPATNSVLVMIVDFHDRSGANTTAGEAANVMNQVREFHRAGSFQQVFLEPITVTPVLRLPRASTEYAQAPSSLLIEDARTVAALSGYDNWRYRFDVVTFRDIGFPWGGLGYIGGKGAFVQGPSFLARTVEHELGHNFGVWHAGGWVTDDESIIGPGRRLEYGHEFDVMGSGGGHLNAAFKTALGWLPEANTIAVSASGLYRLHAMDSGDPLDPSRAYALRVPVGSPLYGLPSDYWLEFRQQHTNNALAMSGALVHWATNVATPDQCQLLDMNPAGVSGFRDAPLVVGRTFADSGRGIFITPLVKGGSGADSWLDIDVRFRPTNTSSPVLSIAASSVAVNPGETVQFTATASDADGDILAFRWDFGDRSVPETSLNQSVANKSWPVAGEYVVRCTVSDLKGGEASASVLVRVGNPTTFRVSGRVFFQSVPLHDVHVFDGLSGPDYRSAFTDSDGRFTITGLSAGSYAIVAVKAGHLFDPRFNNPVSVGPASVEGLIFETVPPGTLQITSFSPTTGIAGSEVIIRGMNFDGLGWYLSEVKFGALAAAFRRVTASEIIATVPPGAVTAPIVLLASSGMTDTSSVPFTVLVSLPVFLTSPRSQTNFANWPTTFAAAGTGSGPLWWQWRKDGVAIPDATNATYTLVSPQLNDGGFYDAVLRNPLGSATSKVAVLTILPAPTLAEALDTDGLVWTTGGQQPWLTQTNLTHDGIDGAENGNLPGSYADSWLETTVTVNEPTVVRFWWRTDRGSLSLLSGNSTDFTTLWQPPLSFIYPPGIWREISVLLPIGSRTLRWRSAPYASNGKDWLDNVSFVTGAPPSIIEQPADQTVPLYGSAIFSLQADGTAPLRYTWYRSAGVTIVEPISGGQTFTIHGAGQGEQFWRHWVVVANDFGAVTSKPVRVNVVLPPSVTLIWPNDDEIVSAGDIEVRVAVSSGYPVQWVELVDDETEAVLGRTNALAADGTYIMTFTAEPGSHFDLFARAMDTGGQLGGSIIVDVDVMLAPIPLGSQWKYLDTGANLGTNWRTAAFNDSAWRSGPAQLGFGEGDEATVLASNRQVTTYFRHQFLMNDPDGVYQLLLRFRRDDGAIVYLNGAELLRENITNAAVISTTLAFLATDDGALLHEFELPPTLLVAGTNLLAVEVHQSSANSSDLSFDLGIDATWFANRSRGVWVTLSGSPFDPFIAPQPIPIGAEAVAGGTLGLTRVEFHANGMRLGEDIARPWSFIWSNAPVGPHELTAVAFDAAGASIMSAPVTIWILPPPTATALVSFGEDWQYLDTGLAPGYDWFWNLDYDDSSWAVGPARLGYGGDAEATTISFGPDPNAKYTTSWFRKKFYTTEAQDFSALKLRVARDDGVLVFLNGQPLLRDNLRDSSDATSFATTVVGGSAETTPIEVVISNLQFVNELFRYGENLFAVEVHQAAGTSSDLGFDLALSGLKDTSYAPATLLTAPVQGEQFTGPVPISVYVVGTSSVRHVEFFADGIKLGEVASVPALTATFTWTNPPHGSHELTALAHLIDGSMLASAPVTVMTVVPRFAMLPLVAANADWRYRDDGVDRGTAWRVTGYNDFAWPASAAKLGFGDAAMTTTLRSTNAAGQRIITYYFRHCFTVPTDFVVTNLQMRIQRDDAVVVYLNGIETFRDTNMPSGGITFTTRARTALGGIDETAWCIAELNAASLVPGTNVLAVELHQASTNSSDAAFAFELRANGYLYIAPTPPVPPLIHLTRGAAGEPRITFPEFNGRTYVIEASTDLRTWTSVATNTISNGLLEHSRDSTVSTSQFFRARWQPYHR